MLKWMKLLPAALLTILLLAACGTAPQETATPENESSQDKEQLTDKATPSNDQEEAMNEGEDEIIVEEVVVTEEEADAKETDTEKAVSKEDSHQEERSEEIKIMEKNLTYSINGEEKEETAFLKKSDTQAYSLYVLPNYTLTGEEPGKDVLYFEGSASFMRIEILAKDINMDDAVNTMKEQLAAVDSNVVELEVNKDGGWLQNAIAYKVKNDEDQVTSYLIKKENATLKLTIFSIKDASHEDAFLKMAATIETN